jgi:CRP-like cAMP-binding protein
MNKRADEIFASDSRQIERVPKMSAAAMLQSLAASKLLSTLPRAEQERLLPDSQLVTLPLRETVYEINGSIDHMYFPASCIVALVYTMESGMTAQMGLIGREGAVGLPLLMGGGTVPNAAVVQLAGKAIRIRARALREEFERGGALQRALLRYTQALITQISQTAVCNRLHSVEQRLCRWLLLCHDRAESSELRMTQEAIAEMLGGRRQSVTVAAGRLQDAGLIHYSRGHINILNRPGLEASTCECSRVVKAEFDRLLGAPAQAGPQTSSN